MKNGRRPVRAPGAAVEGADTERCVTPLGFGGTSWRCDSAADVASVLPEDYCTVNVYLMHETTDKRRWTQI